VRTVHNVFGAAGPIQIGIGGRVRQHWGVRADPSGQSDRCRRGPRLRTGRDTRTSTTAGRDRRRGQLPALVSACIQPSGSSSPTTHLQSTCRRSYVRGPVRGRNSAVASLSLPAAIRRRCCVQTSAACPRSRPHPAMAPAIPLAEPAAGQSVPVGRQPARTRSTCSEPDADGLPETRGSTSSRQPLGAVSPRPGSPASQVSIPGPGCSSPARTVRHRSCHGGLLS